MGRGQRPSGQQQERYWSAYRAAYPKKRAEAIAQGVSSGMADYMAERDADIEAIRVSGIDDPSRKARDIY